MHPYAYIFIQAWTTSVLREVDAHPPPRSHDHDHYSDVSSGDVKHHHDENGNTCAHSLGRPEEL